MKLTWAFNKKAMTSKCSPWRCLCKMAQEKKIAISSIPLTSWTSQEWTLFRILNLSSTQIAVQLTLAASYLHRWIQISKGHHLTATATPTIIITAVGVAKPIGVIPPLRSIIPHRSLTILQSAPTVSWTRPSIPSFRTWILLPNIKLNCQYEMNQFISPAILKRLSYL